MSFFNKDEKKRGGPIIPGSSFNKTSAFGKTPMLSRVSGGLMDRLKNLSRKDMAFVGIGLSVLTMAPVAEYMMSQPVENPMLAGSGFGSREGSAGIYEPGVNGLSTGSPDGSGEVITPLSSRDPASLILGAQQAPPVVAAAAAPPSSNWRDAVQDSGRAAFSAASKSAGAPTPIPALRSALRSLSFSDGGGSSRTSGTLGSGNIINKAKSASSKAASHSMTGAVGGAGYKGVASTPNSASKGAFEKLRAQSDRAASNFTGGSAMDSLDKAAADSVDAGAGAGGAGGLGDSEKTGKTGSYDNKYQHQRSGESLAEMAAKQRMQEALKWEFFKKYEIPKTIINAIVGKVSEELASFIGGNVHGILNPKGPSGPAMMCWKKTADGWRAAFPWSSCTDKDGKIATACADCEAHPADWNGGGTPGTTGGNTTSGHTPGHNGVGKPEIALAETKGFDETLQAIMEMVQDTAPNIEKGNEKVHKATVDIGNKINNLMVSHEGDTLPGILEGISGSIKTYNGDVQTFSRKVDEADVKMLKAEAEAQKFVDEATAILPGGANHQQYLKSLLKNYIEGADLVMAKETEADITHKRDEIAGTLEILKKMEPDLKFEQASVKFFKGQSGVVDKDVETIREEGRQIAVAASAVAKAAGSITEDQLKLPENKVALKNEFLKLWGNENSAVQRLLALRGAVITDNKVDDSIVVSKEETVWREISPTVFLEYNPETKASYDGQGNSTKEVAPATIAAIKRGKLELPVDMGALANKPDEIITSADSLVKTIGEFRGVLWPTAAVTTTPEKPVETNEKPKDPVQPAIVTPKPVVTGLSSLSEDHKAEIQPYLKVMDKAKEVGVGNTGTALNYNHPNSEIISQSQSRMSGVTDSVTENTFAKSKTALVTDAQHICDVLANPNRVSRGTTKCEAWSNAGCGSVPAAKCR